MIDVPRKFCSEDEYLRLEAVSEYRNEFYCGEVEPMMNGGPRHHEIAGNLFYRLRLRLQGTEGRVSPSIQRIRIEEADFSTYPDVTVVWGSRKIGKRDKWAFSNPFAIGEVLSPSTEDFDLEEKFRRYKRSASLRHYILVSQEKPRAEHFVRQPNDDWARNTLVGMDAVLTIASIAVSIPFAEIYEEVEFGPDESVCVEREES